MMLKLKYYPYVDVNVFVSVCVYAFEANIHARTHSENDVHFFSFQSILRSPFLPFSLWSTLILDSSCTNKQKRASRMLCMYGIVKYDATCIHLVSLLAANKLVPFCRGANKYLLDSICVCVCACVCVYTCCINTENCCG